MRQRGNRWIRLAVALGAFGLTTGVASGGEDSSHRRAGNPGSAQSQGRGNLDAGEMVVPLRRGAVQPFELTVIETPNDCESELTLRIKWSRADNQVYLTLTGPPSSLEAHPRIERTEGVNFEPNPFFPEQKDIADGRYQLWLVSTSGPVEPFFYSSETLDLLGGGRDFPQGPPEGAIPVPFPTLFMFSTPMFQPAHDGSVNLKWTFPYDSAHRGDRPEFSHHTITFPPPNLCGADPNALHLSTLRPYLSEPLPRQQARPWSDYLSGGMLFDVTVEPGVYPEETPMSTLIGSYSGASSVGGSVPPGYTLDIAADFGGVGPGIRPWPGAQGDGCFDHYAPVHTTGLNLCAP